MKFKSLILALGLFGFNAGAEVLKCDFTEPFFSVEFDSETAKVTYTGVDTYNEETDSFEVITLSENASLVETTTMGAVIGSEYSLRNDKGEEILKLALTFRGSNGMSDHVYPFDVWYGNFWGGCETSSAPAVDTFSLIDSLQK